MHEVTSAKDEEGRPRTGVHCVGGDAVAGEASVEFTREQQVAELGHA